LAVFFKVISPPRKINQFFTILGFFPNYYWLNVQSDPNRTPPKPVNFYSSCSKLLGRKAKS
jgi:hypothetical protein